MEEIITADALQGLKALPDGMADTCVTSPPYYGLRDYNTAKWEGGDLDCNHTMPEREHDPKQTKGLIGNSHVSRYNKKTCHKCGAVRIDDQIGLEQTPEGYIEKLVTVFREVKRVLRDDGTLWVNIGDSYCSPATGSKSQGSSTLDGGKKSQIEASKRPDKNPNKDIKAKDLIGIPWTLAFALRADGWYLRQDIIWHKPNPMPESVIDRCTKSHEYIFLLSKSRKYYFDSCAIREPATNPPTARNRGLNNPNTVLPNNSRRLSPGERAYNADGARNKRDVWSVNTKPYSGAHFAAFPPNLIRPCILAGSRKGGTVLDPFFGSGTTGQVAIEEGRKFVGIEINPDFVRLAEQRIRRARNRRPQSMLGYELREGME